MRLKWLQRVGLIILGAAALGGAVTLSIMDLGGAAIAAVIALIFPGFLLITFALVGVFPNVNLKEGNIDWAKIEPVGGYLGKEEWKEQRKIIEEERTRSEDALRKELKAVNTLLEDYILAHEPPNTEDEDPDHPLTDDERLREMADHFVSEYQDVLRRDYTGEDYDDGLTTEQVRKFRDNAYESLQKELRRQKAQFRFGMRDKPPDPRYDEY